MNFSSLPRVSLVKSRQMVKIETMRLDGRRPARRPVEREGSRVVRRSPRCCLAATQRAPRVNSGSSAALLSRLEPVSARAVRGESRTPGSTDLLPQDRERNASSRGISDERYVSRAKLADEGADLILCHGAAFGCDHSPSLEATPNQRQLGARQLTPI
jgi:hypothetical protein